MGSTRVVITLPHLFEVKGIYGQEFLSETPVLFKSGRERHRQVLAPHLLSRIEYHYMYYVYLLKSLKDLKLYIGYTKDVDARFEKHNSG